MSLTGSRLSSSGRQDSGSGNGGFSVNIASRSLPSQFPTLMMSADRGVFIQMNGGAWWARRNLCRGGRVDWTLGIERRIRCNRIVERLAGLLIPTFPPWARSPNRLIRCAFAFRGHAHLQSNSGGDCSGLSCVATWGLRRFEGWMLAQVAHSLSGQRIESIFAVL